MCVVMHKINPTLNIVTYILENTHTHRGCDRGASQTWQQFIFDCILFEAQKQRAKLRRTAVLQHGVWERISKFH